MFGDCFSIKVFHNGYCFKDDIQVSCLGVILMVGLEQI